MSSLLFKSESEGEEQTREMREMEPLPQST